MIYHVMAYVVALSDVVANLDLISRERYKHKIAAAGVTDPYDLPPSLFTPIDKHVAFDNTVLPQLCYPDIFNYLVETCSFYTSRNMKAYKSLESFKYFVAGWVYGLQTWSVPGKQCALVMSKVIITFPHNLFLAHSSPRPSPSGGGHHLPDVNTGSRI